MGLLKVVDIGIDTHQEPMAYMRGDCEVCRAEGFVASTRVGLECQGRTLIATLNCSSSNPFEITFSVSQILNKRLEENLK